MPVATLLTHLNLIKEDGALANAAILLFGKNPQKYFINSEVKCAQFYGCEVEKPMADHQIYTGDVFDLADQATRFVMTHISRSIGRHNGETGSAPTTYELPYDAVFELIVNAICHRDYTSHESVQVMLFKDRLEIWNAGSLPRGWTVKDLYRPHTSLPPPVFTEGPDFRAVLYRSDANDAKEKSTCRFDSAHRSRQGWPLGSCLIVATGAARTLLRRWLMWNVPWIEA